MPVSNYIELAKALLVEYLEGVKQELIAYMDSNNRNASGRSKASLQVIEREAGASLVGSDYIFHVFAGRAPGRMPPIQDIIDWLNYKGLPRQMAWAVAHNISKSGTELYRRGGYQDNALTQTIRVEDLDELTKNISKIFAAQVHSDIQNLLVAA